MDLIEKIRAQSEKSLKKLDPEAPPEQAEAIVKAEPDTYPIQENLHLVVRTREEMASCQSALSEWLARKIENEKQSERELQENLELAVKNKWRTVTLRKHVDLANNTVIYYEKMKAAVDAGYVIIPDLPAPVFAIRTIEATPSTNNKEQEPDKNLMVGEGEYVSPEPAGYDRSYQTGRPGIDLREHWQFIATDFKKVSFPLVAVRPEVMQESAEAMKQKIFDSISMFLPMSQKIVQKPSSGIRYRDPMVIGKIFGPKRYAYATPATCCFLIAWFLDTRTL